MGNEADSRLMGEHMGHEYTYETIETTSSIAEKVEDITSSGVEQVALVTIALYFAQSVRVHSGRLVQSEQSTISLLTSIRPFVRKTDEVFILDNTMYFVLLGANEQGGEIVQSRLWEALLWRIHNITDGEIMPPYRMTIGHSAYPIPCSEIQEFVEAASEVRLHFGAAVEKVTRKSQARQAQSSQQNVAEEDLPALARKLGIPYLELLPRKPPAGVSRLVDPKLAHELHCYPIGRERNMLTVAMLNPQDRSILDRLQRETGLLIFPVLTHPEALQTALEQLT